MSDLTRREFVGATAAAIGTGAGTAGGLAAASQDFDAKGLPTREFGRTGLRVPILGYGLGNRWVENENEDEALEALEFAHDQGIYYWDTAAKYDVREASSEERVGRILPGRRNRVFLVSKVHERDADAAKRLIERSLKRLRTDYIDLMHVHSIKSLEDAELIGRPGKVMDVLRRYKEEGIFRHIGFTGHLNAAAMKRTAELYDFEAMLIALNHTKHSSWIKIEEHQAFEEMAVPYAARKGMGVIAMKVIRPRETVKGLTPERLIRYSLTLPHFSLAEVSMKNRREVEANLELVRNFKPCDEEEMERLRVSLEPFYRGERLAWMDPEYEDGAGAVSRVRRV